MDGMELRSIIVPTRDSIVAESTVSSSFVMALGKNMPELNMPPSFIFAMTVEEDPALPSLPWATATFRSISLCFRKALNRACSTSASRVSRAAMINVKAFRASPLGALNAALFDGRTL
jgi:hypothetical protein